MELGRVLVVDDAHHVRVILQEFLLELGYTVATAEDGASALQMMEGFRPNTVLLDVRMPGMQAEEVFAALRRRDPALPVVVLTADSNSGRGQHLLTCGAFEYIPKPFNFDVVERVLAAAVASHTSARGVAS